MSKYTSTPVQHAWSDLECFGCGPAHDDGIGLESYLSEDGESLVATVDPDERYTSGADNVAYGGFVASLIDCHSVWTAITFGHLVNERDLEDRALEYVTSDLSVDFERPTPLDESLELRGWIDGEPDSRMTVFTELGTAEKTTATGEVVTVEVTDHY